MNGHGALVAVLVIVSISLFSSLHARSWREFRGPLLLLAISGLIAALAAGWQGCGYSLAMAAALGLLAFLSQLDSTEEIAGAGPERRPVQDYLSHSDHDEVIEHSDSRPEDLA